MLPTIKNVNPHIHYDLKDSLIVIKEVEGEYDMRHAVCLEKTAFFIWQCIDRGMAPMDIQAAMQNTYSADPNLLEKDLAAALRQFHNLGLITLKED